jgi:two-component system copper resistance phosphate regulon response regulator CusR
MSPSHRILVIEDDPRMLQLLRKGLWEHGHLVVTASNGLEGLQLGNEHEFDVILLDIGLPELDGYQVARGLRANRRLAPLLMLTARDMEDDLIRGFDLGADGYMTKPFSFPELLARIDSLVRRGKVDRPTELHFAGLMIDTVQRRVFHSGRYISLTRSEFLLLEQLMQHAGDALPRKILEDKIWGANTSVSRGVLDTLINSLRGKLDASSHRSFIKTIRGLGYCLQNGAEMMQKQNT